MTGGSRGIGAATALRLAQEGADVAVGYVNGKEAAEEAGAAAGAGRRSVALRADSAAAAGGRLVWWPRRPRRWAASTSG
ncbi:hypothetical protein SPURM210S_05724 [Streptomyces purpurascens]